MRRPSNILPMVAVCLLCIACKEDKVITKGNHDIPDAWQKNVLARADMISDIVWTPLRNVPKSYYGRKDVWFEGGVSVEGLPYSASGTEGGFIGRDVSFYTFLSALHNPKSSIYTVDYRQPPYNRDKASIMYGCVCSSAVCFAIGLTATYNTGPMRKGNVLYVEDMGNSPADIRLGDALCYCDEEEDGGHMVLAYDIVRTKSGAISKITLFESAGPKARKYTNTEEQLREWISANDVHIYRLKEEYRDVFGPAPFMEKSLLSLPEFPEALCLEDGDRRSYPEGTTVRINVLAEGYTSLEVYDGQTLCGSWPVAEVVEVSGLPAGMYRACLSGASGRSESTYFQLGSCDFSPKRSGTKVVVSGSWDDAEPLYCTFNDGIGGQPKLLRHTAPNEWTTEEDIAEKATHCRVFFAGRYGIYKGNSIKML